MMRKRKSKKMGVKCLAIKCDVLNNTEITAAVKTIVDTYGKIDILVNNAGIALVAPAEQTPDDMVEENG